MFKPDQDPTKVPESGSITLVFRAEQGGAALALTFCNWRVVFSAKILQILNYPFCFLILKKIGIIFTKVFFCNKLEIWIRIQSDPDYVRSGFSQIHILSDPDHFRSGSSQKPDSDPDPVRSGFSQIRIQPDPDSDQDCW